LCSWPVGNLTNAQVISACGCSIASLENMKSNYHCMVFTSDCSGSSCGSSGCYCDECVSGYVLQPGGSQYCIAQSSISCSNNGSATCSSGKCAQARKSSPAGYSCTTLYYCDDEYYGTATVSTNNCNRCPSLEDVYGTSSYGSALAPQNTTINSCSVTCSSLTGSDSAGTSAYSGTGNYQ
jgi:hypothetical protein